MLRATIPTFRVKNTGAYPRVRVDAAPVAAVGQTGEVLLTETVRATGLNHALSEALAPWRKPFAVHDPGKVLAVTETTAPAPVLHPAANARTGRRTILHLSNRAAWAATAFAAAGCL